MELSTHAKCLSAFIICVGVCVCVRVLVLIFLSSCAFFFPFETSQRSEAYPVELSQSRPPDVSQEENKNNGSVLLKWPVYAGH